jgi:hypothetical protein
MSPAARVTSIDVLPLLASALQKFRGEAANAVDDIEGEVRRALEWIHHDRKEYWAQESRRAQEAFNQARVSLQQAMTMRRIGDRDPSCIDEKRALDRAKRRMEVARQKILAVRHWEGVLDRAADDLRRSRTQFDSWLEADITRAVVALNDMSESLVAYIMTTAPDAPEPAETTKPAEAAGPAEPAAAPAEKGSEA